ncbi:MAG: hypothetical protein H8D23_31310, partial [Candidatus Brocadiales bacterium]|nr:hypothetical protein [Candidatus Brocadiales bacterium]
MKFKQLVVMCFLIIPMAFTAAVADDDNLLDKTQEEIVAQLRQLKISFGARLDPFRRSGFFTSHFANNDELTP